MTETQPSDPLRLAGDLIRCESVTPIEGGALDLLEEVLTGLGFTCHRLPFGEVDNLYARHGENAPNFCFAGHTDVVPTGDPGDWSVPPFAGEVVDGMLRGRGAADMKGAIAAFVSAAAGLIEARGPALGGSISLLITGDEEGPAVNGTVRMLDWLAANDQRLDHCLVGEPTNPTRLGEMIKNGRRGSLNAWITARGASGHVAYPHLADNPLPRLTGLLERLQERRFLDESEHFQATNLEVTGIEVDNPATNVIPGEARARLNIRFNTSHSGASPSAWIREQCEAVAEPFELEIQVSGEPFLTAPGDFTDLLAAAIHAETGLSPELSTTGGTSDARFIKNHCPVAEFGLISQTMHKVDEQVAASDVEGLARIYARILESYFA